MLQRGDISSTLFVTPELVQGTLKKGCEIYQSLEAPLHRAVYGCFWRKRI